MPMVLRVWLLLALVFLAGYATASFVKVCP